MAIVISKNSNLNDDLYKEVDRAVSAVMSDADAEKSNYDQLVKDLFIEKKSKHYAEKQTGITTFDDFAPVSEGDKAPLDDVQETFPKLIIHSQFSKSFDITKAMIDDDQTGEMRKLARGLVLAAKRSRAKFATLALCSEGTSFTYGGKVYDRTTGDGKALFATDHRSVKAGIPTQSNVFTNAFSADILYELANRGRNFLTDSGDPMGFTFNKIVIPGNCPALEKKVKTLISSELEPGTTNNDINIQKGIYKLVVNPLWIAAAGTEPYILMSEECQDEREAGVFYDRTPLDVQNNFDIDSRNLHYNGYMRFSAGFYDYRAFIMGGAQNGTELS